MAKERLSKLQKWILTECLKTEELLPYDKTKEKFFNTEKITRSQQVVIVKSLKNLLDKELLKREPKYKLFRADYYLTEKGFLKANKCRAIETNVSYKEYQKKIKSILTTHKAYRERLAQKMRERFLSKRNPSEATRKWYAPFFNSKS